MPGVKTPEEYLHEIYEVAGTPDKDGKISKDYRYSTSEEGAALLQQLAHNKRLLNHIMNGVNADLRAIRAEYANKRGKVTGGLLNLLGRGTARTYRADAKRQLSYEKNHKVAPYESVKQLIDSLILQIDGAIIQIDEDLTTRPDYGSDTVYYP